MSAAASLGFGWERGGPEELLMYGDQNAMRQFTIRSPAPLRLHSITILHNAAVQEPQPCLVSIRLFHTVVEAF